ncbi:hypothetical protein [Deinococcus sp. ME38]|uniref:hypothetical protein n=1 Tax=Deinococcus sp. ME38 TaxID=3400344 RepID=UPI003B5BEF8A
MTLFPTGALVAARVVEVLSDLTGHWTALPLGETAYLDAMTRCRDLGLPGGAVYDTLIAQAAVRSGVTELVACMRQQSRTTASDSALSLRAGAFPELSW